MDATTHKHPIDIDATVDKLNTLIAERKAGLSEEEIAKLHGYSNVAHMRKHIAIMKMAIRIDQRIRIQKRKDEGVSYRDIAMEMGIPESSVRSIEDGMAEKRPKETDK